MDLLQRYGHLLKPDGTSQRQRVLPALEPGYILPDERSLSDLVDYARHLAAEIRFYNLTGQATGDWRPLLEPLVERSTDELRAEMSARKDWPPHVALFLTFLELFRHLQDDLNELPARHLRHYYENELGLLRRAAAGDGVHVIFELARNAASTLLPAGTLLDGGKDGEGRALTYGIGSELVVSSARIAEIRRLSIETDRRGKRRFFASDAIADSETRSFHTFGRRQLDLDASQRFMEEAPVGFALSSPVLRMAEGERSLEIFAYLRASQGELPPPQGIGYALRVELTGDEGWVEPDRFEAELTEVSPGEMALRIQLTLSEGAPAIVSFDPALHGEGPTWKWPVLRCLLEGDSGQYETLDGLVVERAEISVSVTGVRALTVANDEGPLTPDQPMPLFGTKPRIGSRFYIGSAEVFSKKLSSLKLNLEWKDLPENLFDHYRTYFDFVDDDLIAGLRSRYLAYVDLLYERTWDHRLLDNQILFDPSGSEHRAITAVESAFESAFGERPYDPRPELTELGALDATSKYGFVRVVLSGPTREDLRSELNVPYATKVPFEAFGHQAHARRYAAQAIALSRWDGIGLAPELPNEPYTPTLAGLSLDYTASVSMVPGDVHGEEALYTLGPWGATRGGFESPARLVPAFDGEAALFLGIEGLAPPANLSLLFQIDRGTATAEDVLEPGETEWSYLSGETWRALAPEAVLNDSTFGFQKSGLVVLSVGKDATSDHEAMPGGLAWLRAVIQRPPESASRTLAVHAQAALATFQPETGELEDYDEHLRDGLDPESIRRFRKRNPAIRQVRQPYASFDGRGGEEDASFFRRCSERLRHRNRAVTAWDFERLVLEAFPEVFKVKCLPHNDASGNEAAGEAALVILPDLRDTEASNPLEPRAGAVLMGEVKRYTASGLTTPFAVVHVIHPVYERVRVDARVAFLSGLDAGYYTGVLNEDLRRFLSPWAFEEGQDIVFGARLYRSEILAFMEGRDYVDHVTDFTLYHSYEGPRRGGIGELRIGTDFVMRPDPTPAIEEEIGMRIGEDFVVGVGVEVAETTRSHAILVSHPEHRLLSIEAGSDRCAGVSRLGVGYMTVALDFEVRPG